MNLRKNKGRMRVPKTSAPRMGVTEEFYFGVFCETRVTNFFLRIKHTKELKKIPSRHFLENLPEKASM